MNGARNREGAISPRAAHLKFAPPACLLAQAVLAQAITGWTVTALAAMRLHYVTSPLSRARNEKRWSGVLTSARGCGVMWFRRGRFMSPITGGVDSPLNLEVHMTTLSLPRPYGRRPSDAALARAHHLNRSRRMLRSHDRAVRFGYMLLTPYAYIDGSFRVGTLRVWNIY